MFCIGNENLATIPHSSGASLISDMCRLHPITDISRLSTLLPFCSFHLSTCSSSLPTCTVHLSICLFTFITTYQSFYNRSLFFCGLQKLNYSCIMLVWRFCSKSTMEIPEQFEFCSKLTIRKPKLRHWRRSGVFIANFEQISHIVQIFLIVSIVSWNHVLST